jgi:hypothetical protein
MRCREISKLSFPQLVFLSTLQWCGTVLAILLLARSTMRAKENNMKRQITKYDWVPHEVRREYQENLVAYVVVGLFFVAIPLALVYFVLHGLGT